MHYVRRLFFMIMLSVDPGISLKNSIFLNQGATMGIFS